MIKDQCTTALHTNAELFRLPADESNREVRRGSGLSLSLHTGKVPPVSHGIKPACYTGHKQVERDKAIMKKARKRNTTQKSSGNRLTRADIQALALLDRLVEEDRRIEQQYDLPFRSPRQVATSLQQCIHCRKDIALLIFGDLAEDAAGLSAYARLTAELIRQKDLPTYVIAPPSDKTDLDSPALLLKVHPSQGETGWTTPPEWEALIRTLSDEHCKRSGASE